MHRLICSPGRSQGPVFGSSNLTRLSPVPPQTILHFMVSKGGSINISPVAPKPSVLYLLANSGLMADPNSFVHHLSAATFPRLLRGCGRPIRTS